MNQELPFFSVIIPTYERPAQLALCLRALARQDYPLERFEVIVVDDGSANSPRSDIEPFGELLDLKLFEQRNTGPAGARNYGATRARGEFLAFTDDDCEPDTGWLRALAACFDRTPDRIIGGRTINALTQNPYSETSQAIIEVVYAHFNADPQDARFFASNNFALCAERFRLMKGFDESFNTSEDREICARWRARGWSMTYAPEAVIYHSHPLTLRTLWRQHFGYGRGALRFHRARASKDGVRFRPDAPFYLKLLRACASRARKTRAAQLTALLLWSQLANAAGFFYERYHTGKALR
jgi:glycosyltransferase involved in cell wall biosynthesis